MTDDLAAAIVALIGELAPWLFIVWVFGGAVAVFDLARAERRGELPARPMWAAVRQWLGIGLPLSVFLIAITAHDRGLIPLAALVTVIVAGAVAGHLIAGRPLTRWG